MGGCASRPKEFDTKVPVPAEASIVEKSETEPVAHHENNGGEETKAEETLVDTSEPKGETEVSSQPNLDEEATKTEEKVNAEVEVETQANPTQDVVSEPAKEEAKSSVEAQNVEDKSDAPLVTV